MRLGWVGVMDDGGWMGICGGCGMGGGGYDGDVGGELWLSYHHVYPVGVCPWIHSSGGVTWGELT